MNPRPGRNRVGLFQARINRLARDEADPFDELPLGGELDFLFVRNHLVAAGPL